MTRTGLDVFLERAARLAGRRYAVLAHAASLSADGVPIVFALADAGAGNPAFLLAPEHGYHAVEQDMVPAEESTDAWTGLPIRSLYGRDEGSLRPDPEVFADVDLLVIDLQDVGSRYYTFAATAVWAAQAALAAGREVLVLDRPNPLGGIAVEGNLRRSGLDSFVGAFETPVRHGLTLAELVRLEAARGGWDAAGLSCVAMEGWRREMSWQATGLPWVAPSPNMPSPETALVYPGACLLEATELSEGRGTTQPFLLAGAPGLDGPALAERANDRLEAARLSGVRFVPAFFRPQFQKHRGEVCGGVRWRVSDPQALRPFRAGVELLRALDVENGAASVWRSAPYEFVTDRPAIDLLAGDARLRQGLETGDDAKIDGWIAEWPQEEARFRAEREVALLYREPTPHAIAQPGGAR
jgi:uncharacterized protein YbbC (DUF1343 family)